MRVLGVLDLRQGRVVHGIGGRRQEYRPVITDRSSSARPREIAQDLRNRLGIEEFYLADLDAISDGSPATSLYGEVRALGCRIWVDAGVRQAADVVPLMSCCDVVVLGLETLAGPDALATVCQQQQSARIAFSLDLRDGRPLETSALWPEGDSFGLAQRAVESGVQRLLVLDLARIGTGLGTGTEGLCRRLRKAYPGLELVAGGGISGRADLVKLRDCGVDAALVGSAFHDGQLRAADLAGL